jgi:hypothetical protein
MREDNPLIVDGQVRLLLHIPMWVMVVGVLAVAVAVAADVCTVAVKHARDNIKHSFRLLLRPP